MPEPTVSKHNQRGYCRCGSKCQQLHNNKICGKRVCCNTSCIDRHPRTCKYYLRNSECKWKEDCAYLHRISDSSIKIDMLEIKVKELKTEMKETKINMS